MSVSLFGLERNAAPASRTPAKAVTRTIPLRRFWWTAILLLGISGSAVGWTIWNLRTDSIDAAVVESGNIAALLGGQLSRSIRAIDKVLLEVKWSTKAHDIDTPLGVHASFESRAVFESLMEYRARLPQAFNIAVADEDGQLVVSTAGWPTPNVKVGDRDYFKEARAQTGDQLHASIQVQNRIDGTRTIVFARRLESSSGNFAGIVFASVNAKHFEEIYGSIQSVQNRLFTLLKADGTILVRYPQGQDFAGKKLSTEAHRLDSLARDGGGFRVLAQTDGKARFVTVRAMPEYPLFINISVTEDTALAIWRRRATAVGLGSAVLLACSIFFLLATTRQVRYLSKSEATLAQQSHELARIARYDVLTGLANRMLFMERVEEALARMRDHGEGFSVLLLDLDRFKTVNDSLGHMVGDSLLQVVAQRLRQATRDTDCVVRFGGDEFALLHKNGAHHQESAIALANRILATITEPYDLEGRQVTIGTSIGITSGPRDGTDADALIKNADLALYRAKSEGGNRYCLFEASMAADVLERRELEDDMHKAIARSEFELHYQTILDVQSQECCGAEALVRWRHPERGLIPPGLFIGLAEESGLIVALGEWVLRKACADAAKWPPHLTVAVNISPAQFKRGDLLDILTSALANSGLPAKRLELEITETVFLEHDERTLALLRDIKNLGVSVVLDDFGIGYSSMKYLQMFPIDKIKIDKSFIQSMPDHVDCAAIVCAIAGLGRSLDVGTTAEGVETKEQFELLRSAGCQLAQGYLFSRPVPVSALDFGRPKILQYGTKAA